jgi:hypothetical protein
MSFQAEFIDISSHPARKLRHPLFCCTLVLCGSAFLSSSCRKPSSTEKVPPAHDSAFLLEKANPAPSGSQQEPEHERLHVTSRHRVSGTPSANLRTYYKNKVSWNSVSATFVQKQEPHPTSSIQPTWPGPVVVSKDKSIRRRLLQTIPLRVAVNRGGTTLSFQVWFSDGQRALFKPEQRKTHANFRAEIAAYHLDRMFGWGRVAVVVGRLFPLVVLQQAAEQLPAIQQRIEQEVVVHEGQVQGALIAWHSGRLVDASPPSGWQKKIHEFNRSDTLAASWTDMVVFDALIDNTDRWSGGNILGYHSKQQLLFLDNASAFLPWRAKRHAYWTKPIEELCGYRKSTVHMLKSWNSKKNGQGSLGEQLGKSLTSDPMAPVLKPAVLQAVDERLQRIIEHWQLCETKRKSDSVGYFD